MSKLRSDWRRLAAFGFVLIGIIMVAVFGVRSYRSFQFVRYIQAEGLDDGTADVSAIKPWMTPRFVAVAYGVPELYLFDQLGIEFDVRDANAPLGRFNERLRLGRSPVSDDPAILETVRQIVLIYQANPVTVKLGRVEPWMSIRYIANSTGVPEVDLLGALGLPQDDVLVNKPLRALEKEPGADLGRMPDIERKLEAVLREAGVGR